MMKDNAFFNDYALAHELGMTVSEIQRMTHREWLGWHSYFARREAERPK